jgi:DNA replication protein DnaC
MGGRTELFYLLICLKFKIQDLTPMILAKVEVLVLDDFLLEELEVVETRNLLEIVDDRRGGGMIFCSQIPLSGWHERLCDGTLADAVLDRVVHNAYRIELKGESMRKKTRPKW